MPYDVSSMGELLTLFRWAGMASFRLYPLEVGGSPICRACLGVGVIWLDSGHDLT